MRSIKNIIFFIILIIKLKLNEPNEEILYMFPVIDHSRHLNSLATDGMTSRCYNIQDDVTDGETGYWRFKHHTTKSSLEMQSITEQDDRGGVQRTCASEEDISQHEGVCSTKL